MIRTLALLSAIMATSAVPLPASWGLFLGALATLGALAMRRRA